MMSKIMIRVVCDADMTKDDIHLSLGRREVASNVLTIAKENIPQVSIELYLHLWKRQHYMIINFTSNIWFVSAEFMFVCL